MRSSKADMSVLQSVLQTYRPISTDNASTIAFTGYINPLLPPHLPPPHTHKYTHTHTHFLCVCVCIF
jgi:hypothetical protein